MNTQTDTPETDAYKGTHETHRIGGRTIYGHAEHLEHQRNAAEARAKELESALRLRPIAEAGPVPDGAVRLWAVCYENKWFFSYGKYGATTHFIDIYPPQQ